jgi:hypothetical protein
MSHSEVAELALLYFVLPLWLAAGFADYLCHRASSIELTSGYKESLIHLLMFAEVAVPLLAAIFLEINALVIATMIAGFIAHQLTALWDVTFANDKRRVTPIEQQVHSFLELMPLMTSPPLSVGAAAALRSKKSLVRKSAEAYRSGVWEISA